jgi:flagellar FliJ protein
MRVFQFKLEPLLLHRRSCEDRCRVALADAGRALEEAKATLQRILQEIHLQQRKFQHDRMTAAAAGDFVLVRGYLRRLEAEAAEQKTKVAQARIAWEAKRVELVDAVKQRRILERLKERQLQDYLKEVNRKELVFMNEVAAGRHQRSR